MMMRGLLSQAGTVRVRFTVDAPPDCFDGLYRHLPGPVQAGWERVATLVACCPMLVDTRPASPLLAAIAKRYRATQVPPGIAALGMPTFAVLDDTAGTAPAMCFSLADAEQVADALNRAHAVARA